jgi:hypothetical protein
MVARPGRLATVLAAALFLVSALVGTARAAGADHLQCYRIKDPVKLRAVVDLDSPQFGLAPGCRVSQARWFCVPAAKTVQEANVPILPVDGAAQTDDRICYKVKCPQPSPPDQQVTDQFGTRVLARLTSSILCTPAHKGPTTLPPTTTTSVPVPPCGLLPGPQCGGTCPTGESCGTEYVIGARECHCYPDNVTACGDSATCGGICTQGRTCQAVRVFNDSSLLFERCECVEPTSTCGASSCPVPGVCPAGEVCDVNLNGQQCGCTP